MIECRRQATTARKARPNLAQRLKKLLRSSGFVAALGSSMFAWSGCTRQQYRCKTDTEAYYLLDEKRGQSCEDNAATIRIEVDPRSRMFDPFNPDRPPMPEDDPQANRFLRCVDGKKGYPLWEANGRTNIVENPEWLSYLPLDERGVLVLDLEDAVRIALLNSPQYQSNLEEMYLSALDVSVERFLLDSQFFVGRDATLSRSGAQAANSPFGSTGVQLGSNNYTMRKAYATGATLVADFANRFTWQLAGPDTFVSPSALSFTFIQPLLRRGGRDVALERLTLAERVLLANVRAFERYRRGFYLDIATGQNPAAAPRRRGGAFGGAGLGGFDVLGSVFGGTRGGGGGFGAGGGGGVPGAGGYLGILQTQLEIANQEENITRLQDLYLQFEDSYRELLLTMPENQTEIPQQQIQVAQAQQNIYDAQTQLLTTQSQYQATLDGFKSDLGLPPYLCIEIKSDLLEQFKLISQELRDRRAELTAFRSAVGDVNTMVLELSKTDRDEETGVAIRTIESNPELQRRLVNLSQQLTPLNDIIDMILRDDVAQVKSDIELLRRNAPIRRKQLDKLKQLAEQERGMVCGLLPLGEFDTSFLDGKGLEELPETLEAELEKLVGLIEKNKEELAKVLSETKEISGDLDNIGSGRDLFLEISEKVILGSQDLIATVNENLLAVQLVQAQARTESVLLADVDINTRDAVEIARQNRRDWLNARANLVDTWRQIEVIADDLESVLDFELNADVGNSTFNRQNPFDLRASNGTVSAGLRWDAPITRIQERNNYRQILITYQQAKRGYYQFEDGIWSSLRATLRQIRENQFSFEIQRFAVQNAALQISVNEDIRQINETLGQVSGPTAARDATQGLQAFLATQRQLIGVFINFEAIRRGLDLELGTMEVDGEGLWIDPGPITPNTVGGGIGQAIADYGVPEGQTLVPNAIQFDEPVNVVPTEQMPPIGNPIESAVPVPEPPANPVSFQPNGAYPIIEEPAKLPSLSRNGRAGVAPQKNRYQFNAPATAYNANSVQLASAAKKQQATTQQQPSFTGNTLLSAPEKPKTQHLLIRPRN